MLGLKKCGGCGKMRWGVKKRTIKLPIGEATINNREICKKCAKKAQAIWK
jgi:hypothetical protein